MSTPDTPQKPRPAKPLRARLLRWGAELAGTLVLLLLVSHVLGGLRAPELPEAAPAFALKDLNGKTHALSDYAGKRVVLNFWATWCGPCRFEIPTFSRFARANPDVAVLGIAQDQDVALLKQKQQELGIDYTVLVADTKTLAAYGVDTFPTTVVLDTDGRVSHAHVGIMLDPQLWWLTR
ncbi:MAG: cytochrome c biogenesis protein CcmG/thiol:disulfide interchange protein DsbE [Myxococcota bacterium]|jgi:cytochrome c biogenesis protein CcmG/thiol:disulfide interchange protein DsbE